ncbi:flavin reductase family protein [Arthrobacter sp. GCM10027362]|uniref:flavin reductase family protein n=1 Tax=Arthrobacter sp. GCM10027362 TaxID=3273379 RepID=UPI0036399173
MYNGTQLLEPVPAIDPMEFRRTLGSFASGVVIVTAVSDDGEVHGMTANGFVSVSLDPPLVLVSIGERAKMHARLMAGLRYGVSILGHDQQETASHFAGKPAGTAPRFVWQDGMALIDGAVGHLSCTIVDRHRAGDHTLFIGRVDRLSHAGGQPLTFHAGRFGALAKGIQQ